MDTNINFNTREGRQLFYNSEEWRNLRKFKLQLVPLCEECLKASKVVAAKHIHHKIDIKDAPEKALDYDNLMSLCHSCHSRITNIHKGIKKRLNPNRKKPLSENKSIIRKYHL